MKKPTQQPETYRQKMNKEAVAIGGVLHDATGFFFTDSKTGKISVFKSLKEFHAFVEVQKMELESKLDDNGRIV